MRPARTESRRLRQSRSALPVCLLLAALVIAALLAAPGAASATDEKTAADAQLNPANRSKAALEALDTMVFDKGRLSFTARNVPAQELLLTRADRGQFIIEGVDLLPMTPVSVSYTEMREQDCMTQLLKMVPDINFIFLAREKPAPGRSVVEKVQIYSKESTGISPGQGQSYNPLDFLATGGDLFGDQGDGYGSGFGDAAGYIPPAEPPKYIPPDKPPVYIPPAEPPVYIPPASDPVYVPPPTDGGQADDNGQ